MRGEERKGVGETEGEASRTESEAQAEDMPYLLPTLSCHGRSTGLASHKPPVCSLPVQSSLRLPSPLSRSVGGGMASPNIVAGEDDNDQVVGGTGLAAGAAAPPAQLLSRSASQQLDGSGEEPAQPCSYQVRLQRDPNIGTG